MYKTISLKVKDLIALTSKDIAQIGIASAILIAVQLSIAFLPNVELVSVLIIIYAIHFRFKSLYVIYTFVLVEGIIFGFSLWWFSYLYIWFILFAVAYFIKDIDSPIVWAVISAIYGLLFGTLTAIPYLFIGGIDMAVAYITSGIIFDFIHCVSNFLIVLFTFKPLNNLCSKIII